LKSCCLKEAQRSLRRHRDIATCDGCGALLLAYGNDTDFTRTVEELGQHGAEFQTQVLGKLRVVSKAKTPHS
jgi:hypothetical protein